MPVRLTPVYGIAIALLVTACNEPTCGRALADACRKAKDMAYAMGVQIADDYIEGSPIIGDAATMGATGKGAISLRLTGMQRQAIRVGGPTVRTDSVEAPSTFSSDDKPAVGIAIDGVAGAWGGWRVGQTRMGGVDILGNVVIVPNANHGDFDFRGTPVLLGNGVRIGITEETRSLPAISLTGMLRLGFEFSGSLRNLPTDSGQSVSLELNHGNFGSLEYRLAASKKVGRLSVSSGIGHNVYYISTDYAVDGGALGTGYEDTSFNITRTVGYVGISYTRNKLTYGAELARVTGGDLPGMLNTFGSHGSTASRNYLALGVRMPVGRTVDRR
jgi:hypothetical protein